MQVTLSDFQPLSEIPIDVDFSLEQLVRQFSSIKSGLPEAPKNSKDAYARNGILDKSERVIIILLEDGHDKHPTLLGVLDFAGASINDFEGDNGQSYGGWKTWSSRISSRGNASNEIEGGMGNGGKAFMVGVSTLESSMHSSKDMKRTKMGFQKPSGYKPGYYKENGIILKDVDDPDPIFSLKSALSKYSINLDTIGTLAPIINQRKCWTLVELVGVKEIERRWTTNSINLVLDTLKTHPQCVMTIETSSVYLVHNGKIVEGPICPEKLEPMDLFKEPFVFPVPDLLTDPISKEKITFLKGDVLTINTSKKTMHLNPSLRPLNTLRIKKGANIVGYIPMSQIASQGVYGRLFGELICNSLTVDDYSGQLRTQLTDTKRTRALIEWLQEQLDYVSEKIKDSLSEKVSSKERMEVEERLLAFRKAMADFLDIGETPGGREPGASKGGNGQKQRKLSMDVEKVVLEGGAGFISIPTDVKIPIQHEALDVNGNIVPGCHFAWDCDPRPCLELDGGGNIKSNSPGKVSLWVTEINSQVKSDVLEVSVFDLKTVTLNPEKQSVMRGEKISLNISALSIEDEIPKRLALEYEVLPGGNGIVGKLGFFTAGDEPGKVTIRAIYGGGSKIATTYMEITEEKKESKPTLYKGGGVPYIVLCGNEAPGCTDLPPSERTKPASPDEPTIIMYEPMWNKRNIIWINPESAESRRVRGWSRGNLAIGRINTKTFGEFLALKSFEILKLLRVQQKVGAATNITPANMIEALAQAEIETAPFIDVAYRLVDGWEEDE